MFLGVELQMLIFAICNFLKITQVSSIAFLCKVKHIQEVRLRLYVSFVWTKLLDVV